MGNGPSTGGQGGAVCPFAGKWPEKQVSGKVENPGNPSGGGRSDNPPRK